MTCESNFTAEIVKDTAEWVVPVLGAFIAVFFTPMLDKITLRLSRADLRASQFEEFARDLSTFIFNAELMHEFESHGWGVARTYLKIAKHV